MRNLVVLFIHFIATLARLLGPGGVRSLVAESLLKHQLLIVNRSRQRSPNLHSSDRILAGLLALLVRPTRLLRSAIALKPSTLLGLHKAMSKRKRRETCTWPQVGRKFVDCTPLMRQFRRARFLLLSELPRTPFLDSAGSAFHKNEADNDQRSRIEINANCGIVSS